MTALPNHQKYCPMIRVCLNAIFQTLGLDLHGVESISAPLEKEIYFKFTGAVKLSSEEKQAILIGDASKFRVIAEIARSIGEDEELRKENPSLQRAWDDYQRIKGLCL